MNLIKKPCEIIAKRTITALIYGQSGMGKTTLACSAPSPVVLDFDGGISRVNSRDQVDTVQVANFGEAQEALEEIKSAGVYKTIIIDTASKLIDCIITDTCGTAIPKISQWGAINAKFKNFVRAIGTMGLNVVMVAQREAEKDGEQTRYVPQFRASNYKDVLCDLDLCGYMEMANVRGQQVRKITFAPTDRSEGKCTGGFAPEYIIAELSEGTDRTNQFLSRLFADYAKRLTEEEERKRAEAEMSEAVLAEYSERIAALTTADEVNEFVADMRQFRGDGMLKLRIGKMFSDKVATLPVKRGKEGSYEAL